MTFEAIDGMDMVADARFPLGGARGTRFDTPNPLDRFRQDRSDAEASQRRSGGSGADYVELHAHSAYSFLDGASLPEELAARAAALGYDALALTDHDGVYGSLEFAHTAKHFGVRAITGAEVTLRPGREGDGRNPIGESAAANAHITLLCETQAGYANLCRILTDAHAGTR